MADAVRHAGVEALSGAARRADQAKYQEVDARSALARVSGMPFRWALNPYRGCTHACEYCYARKYQRHLELGASDDFSSLILVKRNLPAVLARELDRPGWASEDVAVGTATDAYQPIEGHYRLTRRCLEVLTRARTPFSIVTKGPMAVRDLDLLQEATRGAGCRVFFSVPTVDERAWATLEPGTAPPLQRLRAARELCLGGVDVGVLMMPLVPGISTSRSALERTVAAIFETGSRVVGADVARLDPVVREHFFAFLGRERPDLLAAYERLYATGARAQRGYVNKVKKAVRDATARQLSRDGGT